MIISNTGPAIADLRRRIAANKGIAKRAHASAMDLRIKAARAERQIEIDQRQIEAMGGKVKRAHAK